MEVGNSVWILLASAFFVALLGIKSTLVLIGIITLLVFSFLVGLIIESEELSKQYLAYFKRRRRCQHSTARTREYIDQRSFRLDKRLTGSSIIDDALQEVLQYIIRDFVEVWYSSITSDVEFLFELKKALQQVIIGISSRCKEVDWLPFLTANLVDIASTHIRLYRQARSKWKDKQQKSENQVKKCDQDLESIFFELEQALENKISRKKMCTDSEYEKECLKVIADLFLYLVGPKEELCCYPVQLLSTQILVSQIILPLFKQLSDPDFINQIIIWLCKDFPVTSESFLTALRVTESVGELEATKEMLNREIALLRSHDLGGDDDIVIKQQLSSLLYVKQTIDMRLHKLQGGCDSDSAASSQMDWSRILNNQGSRLYQLPLDVILKNGVALSYLLDFMSSIGSQAYLFFLLNAEGWKIAAEQQIASIELKEWRAENDSKNAQKSTMNSTDIASFQQILANMREAAMSIYDQYLSEKAAPRLRIDDVIVRRLLFNIKNEQPNETWFDEVQAAVVDKLQKDERFMPSFRKSVGYVRLLAELDLLKDTSKSDEEDTRSLDEISIGETFSLCLEGEDNRDTNDNAVNESTNSSNENTAPVRNADCTVTASICQKGVVKDGLTSHAVYAVMIVKCHGSKELDSWIVYRRYSDFLDFHQRLIERFKNLSSIPFPGKRTFNNMDKLFLDRRQYLLNEYLQKLLNPDLLAANPGLQGALLHFFDRGSYEHSKGAISRKVDSFVSPLVTSVRSVTKAVRWVPDSLFKGFSRTNESQDASFLRVDSAVDFEGEDVPLRILLFLMDEIFDLQNRNQWLRKRIFYMLREILRAMFGDVFNRRIVDSIASLTSPEQVAEYIRVIKNSFWPNGVPAMARPPRDEATKMRTRVAAKMALLSCISDEMKHLIGSETTRHGVLRLFELFQHPVLNRRLLYVLLEGLMDTLFAGHNIAELFQKLHSSTAR